MKILNEFIRKAREVKLSFLSLLLLTSAASSQVTITNVTPFGDTAAGVTALNNLGQVVGFFQPAGTAAQHAFLSSGGVLYDLGTLGGSFSLASGINATNQIIGSALTANDAEFHAFLITDGAKIDLGTLGGTESSAVAINNSGQITGNAQPNKDPGQHAFLYTGGSMVDLGTLGGADSSAAALNNSGQVAGESHLAGGADSHAFAYSGNVMYDLGSLGGTNSAAWSLNDAGAVAGDSETTNGETHAFLFSNGLMTDLGTLGGTFSTAYVINNTGQIIGDSTTTNEAQYHGFVYQNGAMLDLGTLGGDFTSTSALNNRGQVVGSSDDASHSSFPFLWDKGVMVNLNSLLPPDSGWMLLSASLINDAGQIVGYGSYNGSSAWFLLTLPTPNRPPVADAGTDQTVECPASVVLDGGKSSDPDQDSLTFEWRDGNTILGRSAALSIPLALGTHLITLTVTDPGNLSSQSTVTVSLVDTTPPSVVCPPPLTGSANANCQAAVPDLLAGLSVSDACASANQLVKTQTPSAGTLLGLGIYPITVTVTDASRNASSCTTTFTVTDTTPPVINCPVPVIVQPDKNCQGLVPDFLASLSASDNCALASSLAKLQTPPAGTVVGSGSHPVTLRVADGAGNVSSCTTTFTVADSKPPVVNCPPSVSVRAEQNCQAAVPDLLARVRVLDNCTPAGQLVKTQNPPAGTLVGLGTHPITVTVTDAAGNTTACAVRLKVIDSTAPVVQSVVANPNVILQTNKQMVPVTVSVSASDNCDSNPVSRIISITSSDPVKGPGDNTRPDWQITGPLTASVRAERSPTGGDRTYTITVRCRDSAGNHSTKSVTVIVQKPHNP